MACCKRPLWWFVGSGALFVIGLFLIVVAGLSKTTLYDTIVKGVYKARYIDNTYETEGCSTLLLGDITCPGQKFKGWAMSSEEKLRTCMLGSAPDSKALASASKWCENGKAGCVKPESCKPGTKYSYSFFNVLNADEILRGLPAEVKEMEPVRVRKAVNKFAVDTDQLNRDGIVQWSETNTWELMDPSQSYLLDQVIVTPNPVAFISLSAAPGTKTRMTTENLLYLAAAAKLYSGLQAQISEKMAFGGAFVGNIFSGEAAINWTTLVKDAYRNSSPILALGKVFANNANCRTLMSLITVMGILPGNADFFSLMMCTDAYDGNIALTAFSKVLEMAKIKINPDDGILFYEYEKNCRVVNEKPSYLCPQTLVCPDAATRDACLAPSLSQLDVDKLFAMFDLVSADVAANRDKLIKFVDTCEIDDHVIQPPTLCAKVIEQLQKAGHAAVFSANPDSDSVMAAYGWTDRGVAAQMIPYFLNGTVGQLMNYNETGLPLDPLTSKRLGLRGWSNSNETTAPTNQFSRQQVSSKFGQKGLNYFKSAMGRDQSCAFDYRCMTQASFVVDGQTCTADAACQPTLAEGYDVGVIPGRMFGSSVGTEDFHGVGKNKTLFVSDLFVKATFTQVNTDASWGGIVVDKWNISSVGMRTENCDAADPMDRGIDCVSPPGTINVGYNAIYGQNGSPRDMVLPMYSSFPLFRDVFPDPPRRAPYSPLDKVVIHECDSCPSERDFTTVLWTEPQTGLHVKGSQKIQLNMRFAANSAEITKLPNSIESVLQNGSVIIDSATDVVLPMYWVDKFDSAAEYQRDQAAFVQSVPRLFNIVFWVCLWVGIVALAVGGVLLWKGLKLRDNAAIAGLLKGSAEEAREDALAREATEAPVAV